MAAARAAQQAAALATAVQAAVAAAVPAAQMAEPAEAAAQVEPVAEPAVASALAAAAAPLDAVAQTHKAAGTGVAATDEGHHAPAITGGMIYAVNTNFTHAFVFFDIVVIRVVVAFRFHAF